MIGFPVGIGVTAKEMGMDNRDPVTHVIMRNSSKTELAGTSVSVYLHFLDAYLNRLLDKCRLFLNNKHEFFLKNVLNVAEGKLQIGWLQVAGY